MTTQTDASAPDRSVPDIAPRVPILRLSEPVSGVVAVAGEVDIDTAPLLEDHLLGLAGSIRLDMREVTFIDSSGVRALVRMQDHCERDGRSLWVHACSPQVERLLHSLGLTRSSRRMTTGDGWPWRETGAGLRRHKREQRRGDAVMRWMKFNPP